MGVSLLNEEWAEPLPVSCPPREACEPENKKYYRLVDSIPPKEVDFYSFAKLKPTRNYGDKECEARSCSLWTSYNKILLVNGMPRHKGQKIVRITLPPESGLILENKEGHVHWWRRQGFNPLPYCEEVKNKKV